MTKREALQYFKRQTHLAKALGITKQSVALWEMDEDIPELRAMQLKHNILPKLKRKLK